MHVHISAESQWCTCLDLLEITKTLEMLFDIQQRCVISFTQLQEIVYHLQYCWLFLAKQGRVGHQRVFKKKKVNKSQEQPYNSFLHSCMHLY